MTDHTEETFKNLFAVHRYLVKQGVKICKSTLYVHFAEGKIQPRRDGLYTEGIVTRYAKNYLKRIDGTKLRNPMRPRRRSLEAKLDSLAIEKAPEIMTCVGGDPGKVDDLIEFLRSAFDDLLYSAQPPAADRPGTLQKGEKTDETQHYE